MANHLPSSMEHSSEKADSAVHDENTLPHSLATTNGKHDLDQPVKLDKHGFPLIPQPSSSPDDPLVSP